MPSRYYRLPEFLALVAFLLFGATLVTAQDARVQVIHNAADPGAAAVDVYIEQVSTTEPAIPNFAFRAATPYIDLPSGTELTVTIAPPNSNSANDGIASFNFTLDAGATYQLIANGVLDPNDFAANPDNISIGFELLVNADGREESTNPEQVQFNVVHGATDAPAVDVVARGVATLVEGAAYGAITGYLGVPAASYLIDITPAGAPETIVATFSADLSGAAGAALTVLASGFLSPGDNQDGEAFGLLAVFPNGDTALLPAVTDARVQVIHNAADPAAALVDIYIEEVSTTAPAIPNFAFRAATPYIDLPAGTELTISVAPPNSSSAAEAIASFPVTLTAGATYSVVANGVLDPDNFSANPDGRAIGFTLFVDADARETSSDPEQVQFSVVHGSSDAPTVNVVARDVATLVEGAAYGDITGYIGVPAGAYTIDITTTAGDIAATFGADLTGAAGAAFKVIASGFLAPGDNQGGEAFGLLAVFPDGTTALLPTGTVSNEETATTPATFSLSGAYPNPTSGDATLRFNLGTEAEVTLEVYDLLGRQVLASEPRWTAPGADQALLISSPTLSSGTYIFRVTATTLNERLVETGRLTVVR